MEEKANKNKIFNNFSKFFSKLNNGNNKLKIGISIILMIIIILIFISSFKDTKTTNIVERETSSAWVEYCETQENRLEYVLGQMRGIKNVNVFIMVDASPTIKYLEETKTENQSKDQLESSILQTTIVMSKNGSLSSPVVVVEMLPKIKGVLIVANGASDIKIKTALINTVSAILNVSVSCVEVLEGK